jgi:hypothetical protein
MLPRVFGNAPVVQHDAPDLGQRIEHRADPPLAFGALGVVARLESGPAVRSWCVVADSPAPLVACLDRSAWRSADAPAAPGSISAGGAHWPLAGAVVLADMHCTHVTVRATGSHHARVDAGIGTSHLAHRSSRRNAMNFAAMWVHRRRPLPT